MRIIGGLAKGRSLRAPPGLRTRPMTDRVREAVFSAITPVLLGSDVLDLYAGTGSLGLEALSRGASTALFVERDRLALKALRGNIERVGLGGRVVVLDVGRFLTECTSDIRPRSARYDLVFIDPPYSNSPASVVETLSMLRKLTRTGGTAVVHRRVGQPQPRVRGFDPESERTYGTALIWRFRRFPISDG